MNGAQRNAYAHCCCVSEILHLCFGKKKKLQIPKMTISEWLLWFYFYFFVKTGNSVISMMYKDSQLMFSTNLNWTYRFMKIWCVEGHV